MVGMEGAAVSGILNILANKLAPLVIKQYSSIVGVTKDLQDLQGLVEEINCWLEKAGYNTMGNSELFNWLRQLKHAVYDVDDIVDEFHLEAEKHEADVGKKIVSKWLITKPKSFMFQCKAALKIKAIKERFSAIVKQRNDFIAIVNSLPDGHPVPHIKWTARTIPTLPIVDEALVRGRDKEKHEIISKLVDNNDKNIIKIVSVIGLGGCGKTTLAKLVFNDENIVKDHFKLRIWVHVSQEFDIEKLIKKMFESICGEKSEHYPLQQMTKTISEKLTGKRYLLVLDDVWTEDRIQWEEFMVHIKNGAPGSSVLLTTRSKKVTEAIESTYCINLQFLSEADSWAVFSQGFGMAIKGLDSEFLEVGREIVNKCGGVPLAIKVLAGVLRDKRRIEEWLAMRDCNLLDVEDKEHRVSACLMLSYFHLPSHLKQCFTMCSLFPKGHRIDKQQLIDQWIAHNMISLTIGVDYLEDIGDECFNSLVQVSFLQDVDEEYGRMSCKMHDLVYDLAWSILHEEISKVVPEDATSSTKGYRYFSLVEQVRNPLPKKVFRNARAIYVDEFDDEMFTMALKNTKHLCGIIVDDVLSTAVLTAIFQVKNLKYLAMSGMTCEALPEAITDIWSLQSVHLTYSGLLELPKSIGKLQKLRTLNLLGCRRLKCLPDSIGDCNMLSSIDLCNCDKLTDLPNSIGRNEKLRILRIGCTKIEKLPSSITKLKNLECLDLCSCRVLVELSEGIGNMQKLKVLNLEDCRRLVELPEGIGNLEKLQVLNLKRCKQLAGMPRGIGQLSRLQKLGLFVVGEEEKFARISELANLGGISEDLAIRGIKRMMEPHDAHKAYLKQKTNLQRLNLKWKRFHDDVGEANIELQQGVLDGLEAPPGIKELEIHGYLGRQYARWMQNEIGGRGQGFAHFSFLRVMKLYDFPNLKQLCGLVELPCLEELVLDNMPSLESVSGGPFSSLVKLRMQSLPCLGHVWMAAEGTMSDGEEGGGCSSCTRHLGQELTVTGCPELKVKAYLPLSLQQLDLNDVSEQLLESPGRCEGYSSSFSFSHLKTLSLARITAFRPGHGWNLLQHMTTLESLEIKCCYVLTELPASLWSIHSLQKLTIHWCNMSSLPQSMGHLTSLQSLHVSYCPAIHKLPECLGELCSLQKLTIESCDSLRSLPQPMGQLTSLQSLDVSYCSAIHKLPECLGELCSLQQLNIKSCNSLSSLPQSMGHLTSLQELRIQWCRAFHQLPECLGELSSLRILYLGELPNIKCLPQSLHHLTSLQNLSIQQCNALHELPECLGDLRSLQELDIDHLRSLACLPESMCRLTSLKELYIKSCTGLTSLPQGMKSLASLENLEVSWCSGIKSLPEGIFGLTALKELEIGGCSGVESLPEGIEGLTGLRALGIFDCPGIKSLPKGIKGLSALKQLWIRGCSDLARSCERGKGADWHLVSHIPNLRIS